MNIGAAVLVLSGTNSNGGTLTIEASCQPPAASDLQFATTITRWATINTTTFTGDASQAFNLWADAYRWIRFSWAPTTVGTPGTLSLDLTLRGYE